MTPTDVLLAWLGSTDLTADPPASIRATWFASNPAFDADLAARFGALLHDHAALRAWADTDHGLLAAILVLDQLSRNIHRGQAAAFAGAPLARELADRALASGLDQRCALWVRLFLYLPFEHAEDPAAQDRAVALFQAMHDAAPDRHAETAGLVQFAEKHRDIIRQFGRFPGRNAALGRPDTDAEAAWLAGGGETFGQGAAKR
jgi:uncharacterized protein (DUF924 family)